MSPRRAVAPGRIVHVLCRDCYATRRWPLVSNGQDVGDSSPGLKRNLGATDGCACEHARAKSRTRNAASGSVDRRSQRQTRKIRLGRPAVPVDLDHTSIRIRDSRTTELAETVLLQQLIGLDDSAKTLFGTPVAAIGVRMVLLDQLLVAALDLGRRRIRRSGPSCRRPWPPASSACARAVRSAARGPCRSTKPNGSRIARVWAPERTSRMQRAVLGRLVDADASRSGDDR